MVLGKLLNFLDLHFLLYIIGKIIHKESMKIKVNL